MAAQGDGITNKTKIPLILNNNISFSTAHRTRGKLNVNKRNFLLSKNELLLKVNVDISDANCNVIEAMD